MTIDARSVAFDQLNQQVQALDRDCTIVHCLGQRFIGTGMRRHQVLIHGTPGNALGAYLNGGTLEVFGNAQDAVGPSSSTAVWATRLAMPCGAAPSTSKATPATGQAST